MSARDRSGQHTECRPVSGIADQPHYADTIWWQLESNLKAPGWGKKEIRFTLPLHTCFIFTVGSNRHVVPIERVTYSCLFALDTNIFLCISEMHSARLIQRWYISKKLSSFRYPKFMGRNNILFIFLQEFNVSCQKGERACRDKQLELPLWYVYNNPQRAHRCQQCVE